MKRIILFRHGKSDWTAEYGDDHDRPLQKRGRKAARAMGHFLSAIGDRPDLVVTSTAIRARDTAERAMRAGNWGAVLEITGDLYGASPGGVLELLRQMPADGHTVVLVGHEPTWSESVELLCGGGEVRMPTAAMACLDAGVESWSELTAGGCTLQWLLPPKVLQKTRPRFQR